MATPAALLQVLVEANTLAARNDLARFNAQLKTVDKTTATATTRTSTLGKTTRTAGSHLRSAAGYAASAAAAYLSISQAKAAVTTTQDLAKTTAGLSRNLGLSAKKASQWGSVAKARDIDAKSLTMSFTTLSRRITDAAKGSDTAVDSFKDIGVTTKDLDSTQGNFNKQLLLVADAFGAAEGGATRQQAAQKLLGRGYQTLLPLFSEGSKSLKEQQMWADKYGTTLNQKTLKAQMDLINAQRESKVAWLGLQVVFTKALTPALKTANEEFQKIAKIMGSDKLTNAEKFEKVGNIIGKWADEALDAFIMVLPKLVERAGEAAPKIAAAFVEGFAKAPIWGQVLLGGFLLSKMGGLASFASLGTKAGGAFGKGLGIAAAAAAGAVVGKELVAPMMKTNSLEWLRDELNLTQESFDKVVKHAEKFGISIPEAVQAALHPMQDAKVAVADMENTWSKRMREMGGVSKKELDRIGDLLREKPRQGAIALDKAMDDIVASIRQAMRDGELSTRKGSKKIHSVLIDQLAIYGISHGGAQKIIQAKKNEGGQSGLQRGGPIDQGKPRGDSVPAMLERGEYVLNRNAVSAVGKGQLDALNFSAAKRFAKGGAVGGLNFALGPYNIPPIEYAADHAGGNSHVHVTGTTTPWTVAMGRKFQQMGWMVGEHPAFGGVGGGHSATGGHYDALAFDANTAADETRAEVAAVARLLGGAGGKLGALAGAKIKLPRFKALAAMFEPGAAGLNNSARGLEKIMGRRAAAAAAPSGVAPVGNVSGSLQKIAKSMIVSMWGAGQWAPFNDLVNRESGWNPRAVNPSSGAAGLAQALPPSKYPPGAWPYSGKSSAVKQLQWMIGYIKDRYGTPAGAIGWHNSHNWYRQGGMVGMQGGGTPGAPPGFDMGKFGTAHMRMAQIPVLRKKLGKLAGRIGKTDESIGIAQTLAGLSSSPGGSDLSSGEKSQQVGLLERLMGHLVKQKQFASMGLRLSKRFGKPPGFFKDVLTETQGVTGRGGRIFDTSIALKELQATPLAGAGGISIDDLLRIREGATLGLFGGLSSGGAAPAPSAAAPSAAPQVNINYANGMEWLRDFVSVQVDGRDRRTNIRSLAGVRR